MFPFNTIIARDVNIYHKHKDIIINTLLLPFAHISNILTFWRWNTFLVCSCSLFLDEDLQIAPHTSWGNLFLNFLSSSLHEHEDGKLQAWDLLEMAHLELALLHPYLRLIHLDATLCTSLDRPSSSLFLHDSNGHKALGHFFIFQPWDQHMAQAMPMDKPTSETQFTH